MVRGDILMVVVVVVTKVQTLGSNGKGCRLTVHIQQRAVVLGRRPSMRPGSCHTVAEPCRVSWAAADHNIERDDGGWLEKT
jgi:hypothetical protein